MALITIKDEKKNIGFDSDIIEIEKSPVGCNGIIDFDDEADSLYCYLKSVCSDKLFESIKNRFNKN